MRRFGVVVAVLLLFSVIPVFGQQCGNEVVEGGEQCDPPGADQQCPSGVCDNNCQCEAEKEANFVLFDLAIGHNMLFSKVQDLLHIIKDLIIQLEFKTIEIQLTNFECAQQPVSFWIPAQFSPYGKLNEIDAMIQLLIDSLQRGLDAGGNFGAPGPDLAGAQNLLNDAENCINPNNEFREAFECKCLAYRQELLGLTDNTVACTPCGVA